MNPRRTTKGTVEDRRSPEQIRDQVFGVLCTDNFLSGRGAAEGGKSKCIWTCETLTQAAKMLHLIRRELKSMSNLKVVDVRELDEIKDYKHLTIYPTDPNHRFYVPVRKYGEVQGITR